MSGAWQYLAPATGCAALVAGALALLGARTYAWNGDNRRSTAAQPLPLLLRISRGPALLIVPAVVALLSGHRASRLVRVLDSLGLYPQVTPQLWFAMRIAQGAALAAFILLLAGGDAWMAALLVGAATYLLGGIWLRRQIAQREQLIARELPAYLDLLTVCVEAGATLTAGIRLIVAQAPASPLRSYFDRVLREIRSGRPRALAFVHVAQILEVACLTTLANALAHAEGAGMSLGQILRTQSEQRTTERFARAERLAMQAPVKMLGPLIFCIFPCTFIVLSVPIVVRMLEVFRA